LLLNAFVVVLICLFIYRKIWIYSRNRVLFTSKQGGIS